MIRIISLTNYLRFTKFILVIFLIELFFIINFIASTFCYLWIKLHNFFNLKKLFFLKKNGAMFKFHNHPPSFALSSIFFPLRLCFVSNWLGLLVDVKHLSCLLTIRNDTDEDERESAGVWKEEEPVRVFLFSFYHRSFFSFLNLILQINLGNSWKLIRVDGLTRTHIILSSTSKTLAPPITTIIN